MKKFYKLLACCIVLSPLSFYSQTVLNADGVTDTYSLINSALAPGYNAVEVPDSSHPEFGNHITQIFDQELNKYVFNFFIHLNPDNDPSTTKTDRQRIEIKTYASSPQNLIGTDGEEIEYKWRFKLPAGFQPSSNFTHIHQIKAVGGDESDPLFSLTLRKGTPNKLELIYVKNESSGTDKKVLVDLSLFEGVWVQVTERIKVGTNGNYSINIKKVSDNTTLLNYSNANIATIRPDNTFIRPKWGIYRSIATAAVLRDENLLFSDFSIEESNVLGVKAIESTKSASVFPNPVHNSISLSEDLTNNYSNFLILDESGKTIISNRIKDNLIDVSNLKSGIYFLKLSNRNGADRTIKFIKK